MNPVQLITLLLSLLDRAGQVGALIETARAEGRDVTPAELDALQAQDDEARDELAKAIAEAKAEGR